MASFAYVLQQFTGRRPTLPGCYVGMGLSALSYLPLAGYKPQLLAALGASTADRFGNGGAFVPHVLQVNGPGATLLAMEGTRNWDQWLLYARGATIERWPHGPGRVFGPFLTISEPLLPALLTATAGASTVVFAGHSLGAAVAALGSRYLQGQGREVKASVVFGCPRCVDQNFLDQTRLSTAVLNHPLDPVPMIPVSVTNLLIRDPFAISWDTAIKSPGQPFWLPSWQGMGGARSSLSTWSAIAASVGDFGNCPHQTFRYINDAFDLLLKPDRDQLEDFTNLLRGQGLFQPWPA